MKSSSGKLVSPKKVTGKTKFQNTTGSIFDRIETCEINGQYKLDITNLELKQWPPETIVVPGIKILYAGKNCFESLPSLERFRYLHTLDLSRNKLQNLNNVNFARLQCIEHLDVSRNEIVELPEDIAKLPVLETCICHRNKLVTIPDSLRLVKSLKSVDLSFNDIHDLRDILENLPLLEDLNLNHNPNLGEMAPRTRRLHEKRMILLSKDTRRALVQRAIGVRKQVLEREQESIYAEQLAAARASELTEYPQ